MPARDQIVTTERDEKVPGLQLRRLATKSVWYLYYRDTKGRQRKPALGDRRVMNVQQARAAALQILAAVARGEDEAASSKRTVADLWAEYEKRWMPRKKPRSQEDDRGLWRKHIEPRIGAELVAEIRPSRITRLHEDMITTPYRANRSCALLHKMFELAIKWDWRSESNPVQIDKYTEHKRTRVPTPAEIKRLLAVLHTDPDMNPYFVGLIELLTYTGARLREIMHCRRDWIRDRAIHLPDSKTGEKIIWLSAPAIAAIERIPVTAGNPYLICGRAEGQPMNTPKYAWSELLEKAQVKNLRIHDLRRWYASAGLSAGLSLEAVGSLLGHRQASTTKGYAYMLDAATRAAAEAAGQAASPNP